MHFRYLRIVVLFSRAFGYQDIFLLLEQRYFMFLEFVKEKNKYNYYLSVLGCEEICLIVLIQPSSCISIYNPSYNQTFPNQHFSKQVFYFIFKMEKYILNIETVNRYPFPPLSQNIITIFHLLLSINHKQ